MNSHQYGLETLSLETKSPRGLELFPCTHSSLTPWPLGWYKLLCAGSRFLASRLSAMHLRACAQMQRLLVCMS